jgi:pimeloyl-ACP methyl ester carboxylesterase
VDVTGASSVDQHVDDLVTVLDAHGLDAVHVCGMSMGGFIAVQLAHRFPDRVRSLVLVDGGPPMAQPPGLTPEAVPAVFADRLARLEQVWPSVDDYLAFFTANTAPLLDPDDPLLKHYAEHDLRDGRVRLSGQALVEDAVDIFFTPPPIEAVQVPMRLLYAQWSSGPDTPPAYPDAQIEQLRPRFDEVRFLPRLDHAGSIMTREGATAVDEQLRAAGA